MNCRNWMITCYSYVQGLSPSLDDMIMDHLLDEHQLHDMATRDSFYAASKGQGKSMWYNEQVIWTYFSRYTGVDAMMVLGIWWLNTVYHNSDSEGIYHEQPLQCIGHQGLACILSNCDGSGIKGYQLQSTEDFGPLPWWMGYRGWKDTLLLVMLIQSAISTTMNEQEHISSSFSPFFVNETVCFIQ